MRKLFSILFILPYFFSCEKAVDFDLDESTPKLVVDAVIENNQPPVVVLTKSLDYFSAISPDILANSFVRNAEVYITTGFLTHRLKEYSIPLGNGIAFYYYSSDSTNPGA